MLSRSMVGCPTLGHMVNTASTMLPLGTRAPDFALPDFDGNPYTLADFADAPVLVVAFICNHCPFVRHIRGVLAAVGRDLQDRGVAVVAINSNDATAYPDDAPDAMRTEAEDAGYSFPYLVDDSQDVAKAYRAACTPDFFVFDRDRKLAYRGQFDDSRPSNDVPVTGHDLVRAAEALLVGEVVAEPQRPSLGCNIKWKAGNAPDYSG
jgi:peroxiredoxin